MISELSTYRITDFLMFSKEALFGVYESYNQALWPVQILFLLLSLILLGYFARGFLLRTRREYLLISGAFSLAWIYQGLVFHTQYLSQIIWAAHYIAWLSLIQGILLLVFAFSSKSATGIRKNWLSVSLFFIAAFAPLEILWGGSFSTVTLFPWGMSPLALGTLAYLANQPPRLLSFMLAVFPLLYLLAKLVISLEL